MSVPKPIQTIVIGFMLSVLIKKEDICASVTMDSMVMDCLVLVFKVSKKNVINFVKARGEIISTHQPYRADEKWESTFSCQSDQFVELKFDTMDFSQIALDIIKIQLLTADLSMFTRCRKNSFQIRIKSRVIFMIYDT